MRGWLRIAGMLGCALLVAWRAQAVPMGIETFNAPHDWVTGGGPGGAAETALPVQLGGPAGPTDPYLVLQATGGSGPGSRLSGQNLGDWTGDYASAGITQILGDANNFGPSALSLRVLLVQFGPTGPVNGAITNAVQLAAGSGWQHLAFDISPGALLPFPGSNINVLLANVHEVRFFHNPAPFFSPGQIPAVTATLGLDNLQAVGASTVPEPSTLGLLLAAGLLGVARRRTRT